MPWIISSSNISDLKNPMCAAKEARNTKSKHIMASESLNHLNHNAFILANFQVAAMI